MPDRLRSRAKRWSAEKREEMPLARTVVACSLGAEDYQRRLDWIGSLTREALRGHERDGLVLRLSYAVEARDRVREMVDRERACCAFLAFDLNETGDTVRLN